MFVISQLDAGGSERVVFDLAKSLDPVLYEVYVAAFKGGVLEIPIESICKKMFIIDKAKGFDGSLMLKLAEIVRSYGIDIVNAHHFMPFFYSFVGTKILNRATLIYTEHSVPEVEAITRSMYGKLFRWLLYRTNNVVGVSGEITQRFSEQYPRHAKKFRTILNGVDLERFGVSGAREKVRSQWGLLPENFVVGMVANFRKVKNHVCLLRAAARLKDSHPHLHLFFVGMGFPGDQENSEGEVRALARSLQLQDKVIFAGYQETIPEILAGFDAFCLPSFSEGLPVSILEAMASKVPVVGSNVKGIREVVQHEYNGLLFDSDDDNSLATSIERLIAETNLRQYLAERAFQYVWAQHNLKNWIVTYDNLFATHM